MAEEGETKPVAKGFSFSDVDKDLVTDILAVYDSTALLQEYSVFEPDFSRGIVSKYASLLDRRKDRIIGHTAIKITYKLPGKPDNVQEKVVILKSKITSDELVDFMYILFENEDDDDKIKAAMKKGWGVLGCHMSDHREIEFVRLEDDVLKSIQPQCYWGRKNEKQGIFVFAMEYLDNVNFIHPEDLFSMNYKDIVALFSGIAVFHARFFGQTDKIPVNLRQYLSKANKSFLEAGAEWRTLLKASHSSMPNLVTPTVYRVTMAIIENLGYLGDTLDDFPVALIQQDCSFRNFCLRRDPVPHGKQRLCLYDWEFATIGPPQMDLAYLLSNTPYQHWKHVMHMYQFCLKEEVKRQCPQFLSYLEDGLFFKIFDLCVMYVLIRYTCISALACRKLQYTGIADTGTYNCFEYIKSLTKFPFLSKIL